MRGDEGRRGHLHGHVEGDGHHGVQHDHVGEEDEQRDHGGASDLEEEEVEEEAVEMEEEEAITFSSGTTVSQGRKSLKLKPIMDSQKPQATVQKRHMERRKMTMPRMMKLSSLSMEVRLNLVLPEFCMSLVSLPAKSTTP